MVPNRAIPREKLDAETRPRGICPLSILALRPVIDRRGKR